LGKRRLVGGGSIGGRVVTAIRRGLRGRVLDFDSLIARLAGTGKLQRPVVAKDVLDGLHPVHAAYAHAQNQVSVMAEVLTSLDEMAPFADLLLSAEEQYMPDGPPMSPLTRSYFTSWAFFDAGIGRAHETIGTVILEVGTAFAMEANLMRVIRLMQDSRMGLYAHEGVEGELAILREIATGSVRRAVVPAGYVGRRGEVWFARVLPSAVDGRSEHVVFTTPYVILAPGEDEWQAYFARTLRGDGRLDAYERLMKYGPSHDYWSEFVFEGYVNHRPEAIFLSGLPDVPESRPLSEVNRWR